MAFRIGQRVVCLTHIPHRDRLVGRSYVEKNGIYTVRAIFNDDDGSELIRLYGIHNPLLRGIEYGFGSRHFRPAVERKTGISVFKALLNPTPEDAVAVLYGSEQ